MKTVWLVRHGESKAQTDEEWSFDSNLSSLGEIQAERVGNVIGCVKFDKVYLSPLRRARQTFEKSGLPRKNVVFDSRLVEWMVQGAYENLLPYDDLPDYGQIDSHDAWLQDNEDRIRSFYLDLCHAPEEEVLVISHAGVLCFLLNMFEFGVNAPINEEFFEDCGMVNAGVSCFKVHCPHNGEQKNELVLWNYTDHVEDLGKTEVHSLVEMIKYIQNESN